MKCKIHVEGLQFGHWAYLGSWEYESNSPDKVDKIMAEHTNNSVCWLKDASYSYCIRTHEFSAFRVSKEEK